MTLTGFLWNYITIPGEIIRENDFLPTTARKKRRHKRPSPLHTGQRGRPTKAYIKKKLAAKAEARRKIKEAANNDPHAVIDTARVMAKDVDEDLSFVLKELAKQPGLAKYLPYRLY